LNYRKQLYTRGSGGFIIYLGEEKFKIPTKEEVIDRIKIRNFSVKENKLNYTN
jgi:hypothetical protein